MPNRLRALISTGLAAVLVIALLVTGGFLIRLYVSTAFDTSQQLRAARDLASQALRYQLDEETGLRGYTSTNVNAFLQPYVNAQESLGPTLARLRAALQNLGVDEAKPPVDRAVALNAEWLETVARPLLASPSRAQALTLQNSGKSLIDHYRLVLARTQNILAARDRSVTDGARRAIDRINVFIGLLIAVLLVVAIAVGAQQLRLASRLDEEQARAAEEARHISALEAAYDAEKRVADTLQEAFTQRPLPLLPTLRFSATYVPATEDTKLGGDWYDALELPHDRVLFAIGDVTGHGIEAAVTMNQARQSLITSALLDSDPASVLGRVNADMARRSAPLVTAVAGYADAKTYEFVYAIAGHPPPVLIEPGRAPRLLDCGSLPLGAVEGTTYRTYRVQSVPGATLVLYTDGAVEHSRDVLEGETLLLTAVAEASRNPQAAPAAFIHNAIFDSRPVGDDVAILTIGFDVDPASGLTISADNAKNEFLGRLGRSARPAASNERMAS